VPSNEKALSQVGQEPEKGRCEGRAFALKFFYVTTRHASQFTALCGQQSDAGDGYGRCEECGRKIPKTRLEAIPYAAQCVRCASEEEGNFRPRILPR